MRMRFLTFHFITLLAAYYDYHRLHSDSFPSLNGGRHKKDFLCKTTKLRRTDVRKYITRTICFLNALHIIVNTSISIVGKDGWFFLWDNDIFNKFGIALDLVYCSSWDDTIWPRWFMQQQQQKRPIYFVYVLRDEILAKRKSILSLNKTKKCYTAFSKLTNPILVVIVFCEFVIYMLLAAFTYFMWVQNWIIHFVSNTQICTYQPRPYLSHYKRLNTTPCYFS